MIVAVAVQSLLAFPIAQLLPGFARDVLAKPGDGESAGGVAQRAAGYGAGGGALIAAAFLAGFSQVSSRLAGDGGAFALGAAYVGMGVLHVVLVSTACMALVGWAGVTLYANTNTIIQAACAKRIARAGDHTYLVLRRALRRLAACSLAGWRRG